MFRQIIDRQVLPEMLLNIADRIWILLLALASVTLSVDTHSITISTIFCRISWIDWI